MKNLNDVVNNKVVKNTKFNTIRTKVSNLEKKSSWCNYFDHINQYSTGKKKLEKKIEDVDKKIPHTSALVITTVLNTKISEVQNKIPDTSCSVTAAVLNTKISEVDNKTPDHAIYITAPEFNNLTEENVAARLKQASLGTNFDNKLTSFNKRFISIKKKHLEVQNNLNSRITKDYNFLLGRIYFISNDGSQNTFLYQPILDTLELKKDKGNDFVLRWKSKGIFNSKLKLLYTAFLHTTKHSEYRTEIKFEKDPLALEKNNYLTKIVNVCIVYDLDDWSKIGSETLH